MGIIEEIKLASKFDAKGFKQAETAAAKLNKSVKNLGKAFGVTFAAYKVTQFGKAAATAFLQDEKAASQLAITMKNLGLQFSNPQIENYIESLALAAGITDDQLRPAMQSLLQVTGSVANSQKILAQSIDVSRGSGVDLLTVANDLAQAYVGNTKGLRKYNLGLTQAELKAASFADIQARLGTLFGGANQAYLTTYAGQMERLGVAAGEAQETIGKGLVDALITLTGSKGINDLVNKMNTVAQTTSNIIGSISRFIAVTGGILSGKNGEQIRKEVFGKPAYKGAIPSISSMVQASQEKKAEAAALKRQKALTSEKGKQLALDKAKASLAKAQANFDITKINLAAALKGKVSEDEKNRLMALQAIENGNGEEALKWIAKIDAARAQAAKDEEERQNALHSSIMAKLAILNAAIQAKQAALLAIGSSIGSSSGGGGGGGGGGTISSYSQAFLNDPYVLGGSPESLGLSDRANTERNAAMNVNLFVDGQQVAAALVNTSNSGTSSSSSRSTGQFG